VLDIDEAVDALTSAGVKFDRYNTRTSRSRPRASPRGTPSARSEKARASPLFRDLTDNIASVLEGNQP
jgi:hypothetical protein